MLGAAKAQMMKRLHTKQSDKTKTIRLKTKNKHTSTQGIILARWQFAQILRLSPIISSCDGSCEDVFCACV